MMSCTIRDVARLAGVSTATVLRVANGASNVTGKTRTKVSAAISELQYCSNAHAAELGRAKGGIPRTRRAYVPALVATKTKQPLYAGADAQKSTPARSIIR